MDTVPPLLLQSILTGAGPTRQVGFTSLPDGRMHQRGVAEPLCGAAKTVSHGNCNEGNRHTLAGMDGQCRMRRSQSVLPTVWLCPTVYLWHKLHVGQAVSATALAAVLYSCQPPLVSCIAPAAEPVHTVQLTTSTLRLIGRLPMGAGLARLNSHLVRLCTNISTVLLLLVLLLRACVVHG